MEDFDFLGKRKSSLNLTPSHYISIYKNGEIEVTICEPDPEVDDEEAIEYWGGKPCSVYITDGKMLSQGGWCAHTDLHKKNAERAYILTKATVGPKSLFETPLDREIQAIDKDEKNKYGAFKRAFLWAEKWLEEHYPEYTILPDEMREQG